MTKQKFMSFYPGSKSAEVCFDSVEQALKQLGIYSPLTMVGALGTIRVECGKAFLPLKENLNYSAISLMKVFPKYFPTQDIATQYAYQAEKIANRAYGNRMSNGPESSGDGFRFAGKGYIQLTGKANYVDYGRKLGMDFVANPNLLLEPKISALVLAQYFKDRGVNVACNQKDWLKVRRLINGNVEHPHGYDLFKQVVEQYTK